MDRAPPACCLPFSDLSRLMRCMTRALNSSSALWDVDLISARRPVLVVEFVTLISTRRVDVSMCQCVDDP